MAAGIEHVDFVVDGTDSKEAATEVAEYVSREFGVEALSMPQPAENTEGTRADAITTATFVISIPSAILAADELNRRLELKQKVVRLHEWSKSLLKDRSKLRIRLRSRRRTIDLHQVDHDDVMDFLRELEQDNLEQNTP